MINVMKAKLTNKSFWKILLVFGITGFILTEILFLTPSTIEQKELSDTTSYWNKESFYVSAPQNSLATQMIPNQIPDDSIWGFNYLSSQSGRKKWKITADQAYMYKNKDLFYAQNVDSFLYDSNQSATKILSKEAIYFKKEDKIQFFGNVKTLFNDGFILSSETLIYFPQKKKFLIPQQHHVQGKDSTSKDKMYKFSSFGLLYDLEIEKITLPQKVTFDVIQTNPDGPVITTISSDQSIINRNNQTALFKMTPSKKNKKKYVKITQPNLFIRSIKVNLKYDDPITPVQFLVARQDVFIEEKVDNALSRYATCGKAEFNIEKNMITLKKFPQVYQDKDTLTGEVIKINRNTDIVEVKYSNAYNAGKK